MISVQYLLNFWKADLPQAVYLLMVLAGMVYLTFVCKNEKARDVWKRIVLPSIAVVLIMVVPFLPKILTQKIESSRMFRFLWVIPIGVFLALGITILLENFPSRLWKQIGAAGAVIMILLGCNKFHKLREKTWENEWVNWYKIPPIVIEMTDYILQDNTKAEKTAVFPMPLNMWVRQYNPEVKIPFSWTKVESAKPENGKLYEALSPQDPNGVIDLDVAGYWAKQGGYQYFVLMEGKSPNGNPYTGSLESSGYEKVWEYDAKPNTDERWYSQKYLLYRLKE
ncbi:hypothetical protein [uncultured Subdoligranulum sp.]|uniref:hypothetical protein n=1 Tax=uncultured Subdoligranulum sp. TaxID=512298 RepID=UPI00320A9043